MAPAVQVGPRMLRHPGSNHPQELLGSDPYFGRTKIVRFDPSQPRGAGPCFGCTKVVRFDPTTPQSTVFVFTIVCVGVGCTVGVSVRATPLHRVLKVFRAMWVVHTHVHAPLVEDRIAFGQARRRT